MSNNTIEKIYEENFNRYFSYMYRIKKTQINYFINERRLRNRRKTILRTLSHL